MEEKGNRVIGVGDGGDNNGNQIYGDLKGGGREEMSVQEGVLEGWNVDMGKEMREMMGGEG